MNWRLHLRIITVSLVAASTSLPSHAQKPRPPRIEWQQTLGGSGDDSPAKILQLPDGGFLVNGTSYSGRSGNKTEPSLDTPLRVEWEDTGDAWIVRLSKSGAKLWDRTLGGLGLDSIADMVVAKNGDIVLGGSGFNGEVVSFDPNPAWGFLLGSTDYLAVRLRPDGTTVWQKWLGGAEADGLAGLQVFSDDSAMFFGNSFSPSGGVKTAPWFGLSDVWTVRLDGRGSSVAQQSLGGAASDGLVSVLRTRDGGVLLCGNSDSSTGPNREAPAFGGMDVWLIRLGPNGAKLWERTFGGTGYDVPFATRETDDGGFTVGCYSTSPVSGNKTSPRVGPTNGWGGDYWVLRVNASGTLLWDKTYGSGYPVFLPRFDFTPAGGGVSVGLVLDGITLTPSIPYRVVSFDPTGRQNWARQLDRGPNGEEASYTTHLAMPDGGAILAGLICTNAADSACFLQTADGYLQRLDARGYDVWTLRLAGLGPDGIISLDRTTDGGFVVGLVSGSADGNHQGGLHGGDDYWVVKLSPELPPDSDGDDVPDADDHCLDTPAGQVVDGHGCSIDQLVPCDGAWRSHGQYVAAILRETIRFQKAGLLNRKERLHLIRDAVRSPCGQSRKH